MKVKRLLEKYGRSSQFNEGISSYDSIQRMPIPNQDGVLTLELVNGTKLRAGIVKESNPLLKKEQYHYAYITLDKRKYVYSLFSGGDLGGGVSLRDLKNIENGKSEFVKFI